MSEDDLSWTRLENSWDRLRWARSRKFSTAKAGALATGLEPGTYNAYERGPDASKHIALSYDKAVHFAAKFGVSWEWLLNRKGTPWLEESPGDRAKRLIESQPVDRQDEVVAALESLLKTGT